MILDFNQTKQLVAFAKGQAQWSQIENFMKIEFKVSGGASGVYAQSLEKHPTTLQGLKPNELENVFSFIQKRYLQDSPLKKKLTPNQLEKFGIQSMLNKVIAEWAGNYGDLSAEEEIDEKIEDLKVIHKDWSDSDVVMYLINRAQRYTPEWDYLEEKRKEVVKAK